MLTCNSSEQNAGLIYDNEGVSRAELYTRNALRLARSSSTAISVPQEPVTSTTLRSAATTTPTIFAPTKVSGGEAMPEDT
jgi:hypothetical protein